MKMIVLAAVAALAFTSGFTCSKNQPAEEAAAPTQEQMAAPADMAAPTEGAPAEAAPTDAAAPTEAAPAEGTN